MRPGNELCHCGRPLHYSDPEIERKVRTLIDQLGPTIKVTTPRGSWLVPRHYIALHGLKGAEVHMLGFEEVRGE